MKTLIFLSKTRGRIILVCLLGICFARSSFAPKAMADDWPQFLGPHTDGKSAETGLLDAWPENGVPIIWQKNVGSGYSAPSVLGDKLVLFHRLKNEEIAECLDADSGESIWRYAYRSDFVDPYGYNNGPRGTPLLTTNRCYTFGAEGKLLCLDLATGKKVWMRDTQEDWNIPEAFFGVGSTPILEGDRLVVMVGGQPNSGVVALNPETGETIWESVGKDTWNGQPKIGWPGTPPVRWDGYEKIASYSTPVAATVHGKRQIFCFTRQGLVSLDPATGAVNSSFWFRSRVNESVNAMNPIVVDNQVFISAAYYHIGSVLLNVRPDDLGFEEAWRKQVLEVHFSTPIYHNGYLYAFSGRNEPDARFRCVEFKTGNVMWDRDESWQRSTYTPDKYGRGSCIMAEGKLIVLGEGGLLGLFKVNPREPEEISRWQVPGLRYPTWTAPVLSNHKLYLRSENKLICLDLRKEE